MTGHVADDIKDLRLDLYGDADFAGCVDTQKSTTGAFMALVGNHTFFPQSAVSKRQGCVSHSTSEAEIVAADHAVHLWHRDV